MEASVRQKYYMIKQKCNNPNCSSYVNCGAKGIKCLLSLAEFNKLWERDNGVDMRKPCLHRIDPKGHYEYTNCQFLDFDKHVEVHNVLRDKDRERRFREHFSYLDEV